MGWLCACEFAPPRASILFRNLERTVLAFSALQFSVQWKFYFVPDDSDVPPYTPEPKTPFNVTTGATYYFHNATSGLTNMREVRPPQAPVA